MAILPRRHRSNIIKVLLLVPVIWLISVAINMRSEKIDKETLKDDLVQAETVKDVIETNRGEPIKGFPVTKEPTNSEENPTTTINEKEHPKPEDPHVIVPPVDPNAPGEMGKPVKIDNPDKETKKKIDKGWQDNAYNQYVSDMISLHRSLPDQRDQWCRVPDRNLPVSQLPATSVIVCFHNEGWTALLRTVHSIIDRSPPSLLEQIVLVDDASTQDHLKKELDIYVSKYPKIKIVRSPERVGLIRARLLGATHASAPVLTYLDSHCECAEGWLEPLLDRIARNPTNVVCPVIDIINDDTLAYQKSSYLAVGGFDWNLVFNWHGVPQHEKDRRSHHAEPVHSPTMAGGLFSIDKAFFEKLGAYDSGFDIWGGENLEISFKTWMCGGTLEIVPCSHVGHIFRKRSPYKWRSGVNVLRRNSIRLAEVWLDDHKKYYYDRIGNDLGNYGDVSSRKQLRENLQCKSFKWYLDNIFPELFIPGDAVASGEIRNVRKGHGAEMCIDSAAKKGDMHKPVGLYPCHNQGGNQYWMMSKQGEIRRDEACLDFASKDVILFSCHGGGGNQHWEYSHEKMRLHHVVSKKCLTLSEKKDKLTMEACDDNEDRQNWKFQSFNSTIS
eukprot:GFUD01005893.1.p1 GENE.GFUD01005893.1~~GFUD01005893.1.p1  ORF type:complete len:612 (+),score=116.80 GFUD01005893.1:189-2024(+)